MFHLDELLIFFLRPPRDEYNKVFLGPNFLHLYDKNYYRKDLTIKNRRGENLKCCYFVPFSCNENTPCVVYSHSVNSCQLEVLDILHILLISECSVFSFDCAGCGLSGGIYSTLGWNEAQDLFLILKHLRSVEKVKKIALWGKYSGAASSIIVAALDKNIKLLILDSPFVSLIELYRTIFCLNVKKRKEIIFKNFCLYIAKQKMKKHFKFDINDVSPVFFIDKIKIPTIYVVSKNERFVHPVHTFYLASKQKNANKLIFVSDKSNSAYDILAQENKLINIIKTVLHDVPSLTDIKNVFDMNMYSNTFSEYKEKYLNEFNLIDKHIKKKKRHKEKIIANAERFIYFKYNSQSSLTSSRSLNMSTMDSMGDFFTKDNECLEYSHTQSKSFEDYAKGRPPCTRMRSRTAHAFPDVDKIITESIKSSYLIQPESEEIDTFNEECIPVEGKNKNKLYKLMHMQVARSSLIKSTQRKYKKSLTWDSNLHRSVSYFKEDCPLELLNKD